MSALGGFGIKVASIELVAMNYDATNNRIIAINPTAYEIAHYLHWSTAYITLLLLLLHIGGALKHHFKDRDNTLLRMLGR